MKMEDFVSQLLPTHAFNKLKNNEKIELTDEFDDVTILFADIAGIYVISK
jgi:hypothetical protein